MMKKQYILFDLDGTLTDPMIGITKSVQYALRSYGIDEPDLQKLTPFIGPPLKDSFMKYYEFTESQATEAIERYREYYAVTGIYENEVFAGIKEMLKSLRAAGKVLLVATSKPELYARMILEHFQLMQYFDFVGGASFDEARVYKADVIGYTLEHEGIRNVEETVMVGDREHDVLGARAHGMECVGVLFGYGSREELEMAGASHIVGSVRELETYLLSL